MNGNSTGSLFETQVRDGVRNLVEEFTGVNPGDRVLIVSEYSRVDAQLPDLMKDAVRQAGGECHVLWAEPLEPGAEARP